jgi:hypothetical protein
MNKLFNAMTTSDSLTENGAITHSTSGSFVVDLFGAMGSMRGQDVIPLFVRAYAEDADLALRCIQFCRDVRGGMGEREHYRKVVSFLIHNDPDVAEKLIQKTPLIGRFDELKVFVGTKLEKQAMQFWLESIITRNQLAAKWAPRKGPVFNAMRRLLGVKPKTLRKLLVENTNVVETKMCKQEWDDIEYSKLPSRAQMIYKNAFAKHDNERYIDYLEGLENGTEKVNSATLYPHEVASKNVGALEEAQWKALPDYVEDGSFLPVVDTSYSMDQPACKGYTCMDISISLGLYLAKYNKSSFKDHFITFSERPTLQVLNGTNLATNKHLLKTCDWGYSTDLYSVFNLVLSSAKARNLDKEEMPDSILILSDMEFNEAIPGKTNFESIKSLYKDSGYDLPRLVFWNLNAREGNVPIKVSDEGTMLVSGFSPAVMKSILKNEVKSPLDLVRASVCIDKYSL